MSFLSSYINQGSVKYGLYNQGATCYLNSVLQVLYMTEDFRAAVERSTRENPNTDHMDLHLQTLFDNLKEKTGETYGVTRRLGVHRVTEQQDAAEYFEKILRLTSPTASGIFHGELTHKITCSGCCTVMANNEAFWHLPIALVDSDREHYSVVAGIKNYFRTSDLSGDNRMYCEICDDKKDATATCVMKHHPEVLMLLLKRFEFDYCLMTNVKINCPVDIACTLQIPENQVYELYAVVDHFGDLRSGHYSASIKDENGWYKFDDSMVAPLEQPLQEENFKISYTAYLLFYRKLNERTKTEDSDVAEGAEDSTSLPAPQREQDAPEDTQKSHFGDDSEGLDKVRQDENEGLMDKHSVGQDPQREQDAPEDTQKSHFGDDSEGLDKVRQDENEGVIGKHSVGQDPQREQDAPEDTQKSHLGDDSERLDKVRQDENEGVIGKHSVGQDPQREQDAPEDTQKSHFGDDSEGLDKVRQDENEGLMDKHSVGQDPDHLPVSVDDHGGNGVTEVESAGQKDFEPKQCPEGETVTVEGRQSFKSPNDTVTVKVIEEVTDISRTECDIVNITFKTVKRKSEPNLPSKSTLQKPVNDDSFCNSARSDEERCETNSLTCSENCEVPRKKAVERKLDKSEKRKGTGCFPCAFLAKKQKHKTKKNKRSENVSCTSLK